MKTNTLFHLCARKSANKIITYKPATWILCMMQSTRIENNRETESEDKFWFILVLRFITAILDPSMQCTLISYECYFLSKKIDCERHYEMQLVSNCSVKISSVNITQIYTHILGMDERTGIV